MQSAFSTISLLLFIASAVLITIAELRRESDAREHTIVHVGSIGLGVYGIIIALIFATGGEPQSGSEAGYAAIGIASLAAIASTIGAYFYKALGRLANQKPA